MVNIISLDFEFLIFAINIELYLVGGCNGIDLYITYLYARNTQNYDISRISTCLYELLNAMLSLFMKPAVTYVYSQIKPFW